MALHTPTSYQHAKGDMDDDVEFATDMEDKGVATIKSPCNKFCCHGGVAVRRTRTSGKNRDDMTRPAAKKAKRQLSLSQYLR